MNILIHLSHGGVKTNFLIYSVHRPIDALSSWRVRLITQQLHRFNSCTFLIASAHHRFSRYSERFSLTVVVFDELNTVSPPFALQFPSTLKLHHVSLLIFMRLKPRIFFFTSNSNGGKASMKHDSIASSRFLRKLQQNKVTRDRSLTYGRMYDMSSMITNKDRKPDNSCSRVS
ncbi:unnamed protein product [Vicia faba]|uniref:Uncharacterized protein n=1 Tax=Vicia faba TaxID=3906 RepID=A0AAV1BDU6_VICFA|nr:unnamed protein product [Vicia faba]